MFAAPLRSIIATPASYTTIERLSLPTAPLQARCSSINLVLAFLSVGLRGSSRRPVSYPDRALRSACLRFVRLEFMLEIHFPVSLLSTSVLTTILLSLLPDPLLPLPSLLHHRIFIFDLQVSVHRNAAPLTAHRYHPVYIATVDPPTLTLFH